MPTPGIFRISFRRLECPPASTVLGSIKLDNPTEPTPAARADAVWMNLLRLRELLSFMFIS